MNGPSVPGAARPGTDGSAAPGTVWPGTPIEVLLAFLKLGLTAFGGPVAHLGYFRTEFVNRRRWLDEAAYAELVALCQFLPGPASSQTGFALGLLRAGPWGALAAWAGFTLPSAALLVLFAEGAGALSASAWGSGLLHGLKLVAVAVVAQAVWGMARTLCPDRPRAAIALGATALATFAPAAIGQVAAIAGGAALGLALLRDGAAPPAAPLPAVPVSRRVGVACLLLFALLLGLLPLLHGLGGGVAVFEAFYRSGALVFGGGHVVLPLLRDAAVAPGWVAEDAFLAGYGAAQAVPGPLFTFAAFLGAVLRPGPGGALGAVLPTLAIFLPGLLLVLGALPFWAALRRRPAAGAALRGANAAVVGLLGAALYDPVWTGAVLRPTDFVLVLAGFLLLTLWRAPPLLVVALGAAAGTGLGLGLEAVVD
ncbi:chromate efflux transporter [Roseomonas sp. BN140053]|uniref:chromate efflux transporter n=1 Tax=Roseomonas sp. BN140053 TaxID=3391898 RepID=UPI0039E8A6AA